MYHRFTNLVTQAHSGYTILAGAFPMIRVSSASAKVAASSPTLSLPS